MKKTILLTLLLTIGINAVAQTKTPVKKTTNQAKAIVQSIPKESREYQVGEDGFEWYKIQKDGKYGAEDRYGNTIVPAEYDGLIYDEGCYTCTDYNPVTAGFVVLMGEYRGWYNKSGRCVIPYSRGYKSIRKYDFGDYGTHYSFTKDGGGGICDRKGREIVSVNIDNLRDIQVSNTFETIHMVKEKRYYLIFFVKNLVGIADANGNIVVTPEFEYNGHQKELDSLIATRVKTTKNPLSGNSSETLAEVEGRQSSSYTSISNNNTQNNNTTQRQNNTIVVEHHRDPIPMQEWQACFACGGMGTMGCDNCGGSGTKYIGDRLHRCSRCNGRGIIPCNVCFGNKGQYITVYR